MKPERIPKSNPTWNPTETQKKPEIKPLRDVNLQRIPTWNPNSFVLFFPVCILNEILKTLGETERNPKELLHKMNPKNHKLT